MAILALVVRWRCASPATPAPAADADEQTSPLGMIALALLGGFAAAVAMATVVETWVGAKWDDLSYHAPAAAQWLVDGRLSWAPYNYHVYFPLNAELLSLWFMLPFRSDALVNLTGLCWISLAVTAVIGLVRVQGISRPAALLSAALLLATPEVIDKAASFSAVDLAGPAATLAAIAFAVPSAGRAAWRDRLVDALYCGLLCGLAVGCRVSFTPVVVVLLAWFAFGRRPAAGIGQRVAAAAVFALGVAATGAYWYVRTTLLTGNPLFPAELGPLAGPFSAECQHRTKLIRWLLESASDKRLWASIADALCAWPLSLAVAAAAGYVAVTVALLRRMGGKASSQRAAATPASAAFTLLLLIGLMLLVVFPFTAILRNAQLGHRAAAC